jgi:hypothetical protein
VTTGALVISFGGSLASGQVITVVTRGATLIGVELLNDDGTRLLVRKGPDAVGAEGSECLIPWTAVEYVKAVGR